jgi:hypothetical protein
MKRCVFLLMTLAAWSFSFGGELPENPEEIKEQLKNKVKIRTVTDDTIRNENDEKSECLKFYTQRDPYCDVVFKLRVTVELTDKEGRTYSARCIERHNGSGEWFTGDEEWEFQIPHGNLQKPKLTAYAIQSGLLRDGEFIPIAESLYKADAAEEILERAVSQLNIKRTRYRSIHYGN